MSDEQQKLEGGAYEVIRARLEKHGEVLRERMEQLNVDRREIFGAIETELLSTERVTTEHNCVPRDMVSIGGNRFLFGYNIQFGLKQTTGVADVFAAYDYDPGKHVFRAVPVTEVLASAEFQEEFTYLYRYYKQTSFVKFMVLGPHLYMAMRTGTAIEDLKVFKWLLCGDGSVEYLGNRFDHEYKFPPQQEFEWKRAHRDMHRSGEHPHISIEDRVFVETVGGDLTIKIEDNTAVGEGIYSEPVTNLDQTLDDAEVFYATVGPLILLKILPYREELHRYLVFNEKTRTVHRLDAIGHSCVLLPDEQGLIFANGYLLLTGEVKVFDTALTDMRFERRIPSANGEDHLYVFYNRRSGDYVLLSYNLIAQSVEAPVICNGYSFFANGELLLFKTEEHPQKHHALQVWQTPYLSSEALASATVEQDSLLSKIGNAELVRGMGECREILVLLGKEDNYGGLYLDLLKKTGDIRDSYFWIGKPEAGGLGEPLGEINAAANAAIDEFDKVQSLREAARSRTKEVRGAVEEILREVRLGVPDDILGFVHHLSELRRRRGEVIGLREVRYVEPTMVESMEESLTEATTKCSGQTVKFLLQDEALDPYRKAVEDQAAAVSKLAKVTEADEVSAALDTAGSELEMLIDVVGNLKIADATETTAIIESVSEIYATLNGVRAGLKKRRKELARQEGTAQFGAEMKLLSQSVVNYIDLCDSTDRCDDYLTKLMVQLEALEGKFAEFEEDLETLSAKREEIYEVFEGRKQMLLERRNRRASSLLKSAERILSGVQHRAARLDEVNDINGYFAGDLMIEKLREIIAQLRDLGDSVKADDLQTRLKTVRYDAVRQLKDRKELFVDGENTIKFGKHQFSVNTRELEISMIPRDEEMCFHLSGTDFFEPITDERFLAQRASWELELVSETDAVYRAEWLVYQMLRSGEVAGGVGGDLLPVVQAFMQARYAEGYTKGVHDLDAVKLLGALLPIHEEAGLLRYSPLERAAGMVFWQSWEDVEARRVLGARVASLAGQRKVFGAGGDVSMVVESLTRAAGPFLEEHFPSVQAVQVGSYLCEEFLAGEGFVVSQEAAAMAEHFQKMLTGKRAKPTFAAVLEPFADDPLRRYELSKDWLGSTRGDEEGSQAEWYRSEAAAHLVRGGFAKREIKAVTLGVEVEGLIGSHSRLGEGAYELHYNEFMERLAHHERVVIPAYEACQALKQELLEAKRMEMRLEEFKPRVMSSFVRSKLINDVYLPIVGDNLAKQIGTVGVNTRTDRMGMLLLISPPGYGKTTLMEYIANRLGLTFMKINGPAIGHAVTSLDPAEAPNLSAREEIEKLNLALEMGDNVMLYVDDIQHCNPEFLQKFISLCDAQRKIEGVYKGRARTYDLRGKKVAVVMAGNPFTESGARFKIPDMLANRADTYNLGDILGGHAEAFKGSYIENALTSSPILSKLANRSQKDIYAVMQIARTGLAEDADFEGNYTPAEIEEFVETVKRLSVVRDSLLRVNQEYIRSAGMEEAYRTEPAFRLQGSYRNMNRLAEVVVPLMSGQEVADLVMDHYRNESQTLTTGAEANLLKFKELEGTLSGEDQERWEQIQVEFAKRKLLGGAGDDDPVARVVAQLHQFNDGLAGIREGIAAVGSAHTRPQSLGETTMQQLKDIITGLRAVPVEVEIKVVPVQDGGDGQIETMEGASKPPPLEIRPEVRQKD